MNPPANVVSVHPYFKVHPGKLDQVKAALPAFIARVATEEKNLYYDFTFNGDEMFCREAYVGAEGLLAHLGKVGDLLPGLLELADLTRIEVHGPAAELAQLQGPLAGMKPVWFVFECGVKR